MQLNNSTAAHSVYGNAEKAQLRIITPPEPKKEEASTRPADPTGRGRIVNTIA